MVQSERAASLSGSPGALSASLSLPASKVVSPRGRFDTAKRCSVSAVRHSREREMLRILYLKMASEVDALAGATRGLLATQEGGVGPTVISI